MRSTFAALVIAFASTSSFAQDTSLTLGSGIGFTSGKYGTGTTTRITSIPFSARYETERWAFKASIPYLFVSGGTSVIPGVGQVANSNPRGRGGRRAAEATTHGLGDLVTSATYSAWYDEDAELGIDVTGKVKWATANADEGLGTGANDYSLQVDVDKTFDNVTVFGGVGRSELGSTEFIHLDSVWYANAGASYRLDRDDNIGLSLDARQRVSPTAFPVRELTAFWSHRIDAHWRAQTYFLKGLAKGSPDWGGGFTAGYTF